MKLQIASPEAVYIEVNGYTIYVDVSIKGEPPIVSYWRDDELEENTYNCEWVSNVY
jgi:hypothetical protein